MRTDEQTGMTKLTVAFRNFANASKTVKYTDFKSERPMAFLTQK